MTKQFLVPATCARCGEHIMAEVQPALVALLQIKKHKRESAYAELADRLAAKAQVALLKLQRLRERVALGGLDAAALGAAIDRIMADLSAEQAAV